jgi:hypothetical protein
MRRPLPNRRAQHAGLWLASAALILTAARAASGREAGDPIQLAWTEGDLSGLTRILSPDGRTTIGSVEYHQHRRGDVLEAVRVAHFSDGSSDEDRAEARVGKTLEAIRGRSIIRNVHGTAVVDITIDVAGGHIRGFSGLGKEREAYDELVTLPAGTYWGPLVALVVKNFEQNAADDHLVFRTVVATPKPRVLDMELVREPPTTLTRPGQRLQVVPLAMRPTINFLVDPIIQRIAPTTTFLVFPGKPPALARFTGPRNYAGQEIRIE